MGVVTPIFSRDATPLAEDPLGGEGRADDLSFLLLRLKDMGEDVAPASGVDSRPHRERAFVQACHQALGSPGVGPDGRDGAWHRSHSKSDTGHGVFRVRRAQQNDPGLIASAHHTARDESYTHGVPGVPPRKMQGHAGVSGPSHCRDMATCRLPMRRTRTGLATYHRHHREARAINAQPKAFAPTNIRSPTTSTSPIPLSAPSMATPCP